MPRWARILLDALLPRACDACEQPLAAGHPSALCAACRATMTPLAGACCIRCGVPLASPALAPCAACIRLPPRFHSARAAALYLSAASGLNPLAVAIHRLKYARRRPLARPLGMLLAERFPFPDDVLLVPVPLHITRLRSRGFNQAALLAAELGRCRALRVVPRALVRTRPTGTQAALAAAARRDNLRGAFTAPLPTRIADRHVVVIDDVLTTGATADACADALLAGGARRVDVYTVARAP